MTKKIEERFSKIDFSELKAPPLSAVAMRLALRTPWAYRTQKEKPAKETPS